MLNVMVWTLIGFIAGSLMFSYWLGKIFLKQDVRDYGDSNPGAANAWKAGGPKIGLPGAVLDFAKGAIPVALAHWLFGIDGWNLVPVALAPILGHSFSPFLKFNGGKAIAVTLGVWSGITIWEGVLVLGILIGIFYVIIDQPSWSVILAMFAFLCYLVFMGIFIRGADLPLWAIWTGNLCILIFKHKSDLKQTFRPRPYILRILGGLRG